MGPQADQGGRGHIGAAGASGAPGGDKDEVCIQARLDRIADHLNSARHERGNRTRHEHDLRSLPPAGRAAPLGHGRVAAGAGCPGVVRERSAVFTAAHQALQLAQVGRRRGVGPRGGTAGLASASPSQFDTIHVASQRACDHWSNWQRTLPLLRPFIRSIRSIRCPAYQCIGYVRLSLTDLFLRAVAPETRLSQAG